MSEPTREPTDEQVALVKACVLDKFGQPIGYWFELILQQRDALKAELATEKDAHLKCCRDLLDVDAKLERAEARVAALEAGLARARDRSDEWQRRHGGALDRISKLEGALRSVKETIEIVLGGKSVIASVALSGAVDVIDSALLSPANREGESE